MSLTDVGENEGFFYIPDSHRNPPSTFLRRMPEDDRRSGKRNPRSPKLAMIPGVPKDESRAPVRIPLNRGDVLVYSGNLTYTMY